MNISNPETLAVRGNAPSLVGLFVPPRKRKSPNTSPLIRILPARKKGNQPWRTSTPQKNLFCSGLLRRDPAAPPATLRKKGPKREKQGRRGKGLNLARVEGTPPGRIKNDPRKSQARRIHRVTLIRVMEVKKDTVTNFHCNI